MPTTENYNFEALKKTVLIERSNWAVKLLRHPWIILIAVIGVFLPSLLLASSNQMIQQIGILVGLVYLVVFITFLIAVVFFLIVNFRGNKKSEAIAKFAEENNLETVWPDKIYGYLPDSIKGWRIISETIKDALTIPVNGRPVNVYQYETEAQVIEGSSSYKAAYNIAAFKLSKPYPHIFLDGKVNGVNNKYKASQKIGLEGDFDQHFTLYAPDNSANHTGALAVISPDVMATLIDAAGSFDIEIKGSYVYIITQDPIYTFDTLPKVLHAASLLIKELEHLDVTWRPIVTPAGQNARLQTWKTPVWVIILIAVIATLMLNRQSFQSLFQAFFG